MTLKIYSKEKKDFVSIQASHYNKRRKKNLKKWSFAVGFYRLVSNYFLSKSEAHLFLNNKCLKEKKLPLKKYHEVDVRISIKNSF